MNNLTKKSAGTFPIGRKKLAEPGHDIAAFPCDPKMLITIAEISCIKNNDVRAEKCVLAGITAEHAVGRILLESCSEGSGFYQDICRERLNLFQRLQASTPHELRSQFRRLIGEKLRTRDADNDHDNDERLYLLCNFLRSDRTIMPRELCDAIEILRDAVGMSVLWAEGETRCYAGAVRWVRNWLLYPELDEVFLLPNQIIRND